MIKGHKCSKCGSTEIDSRNYYKNQPKGTIGFALERYCVKCGSTRVEKVK